MFRTKFLFITFLCISLNNSAKCARILDICHIPIASHQALGTTILKALAAKGHDVTMASPFEMKEKIPNFRHIYLEGVFEIIDTQRKDLLDWHKSSISEVDFSVVNLAYTMVETAIKSRGMQNLLNSGEKFDIVILDPFVNGVFFGLGHHFNASIVLLSRVNNQYANHYMGNVAPFSFVPHAMIPFSDKMSFIERFLNTFSGLTIYHNTKNYALEQKKLYNEIFQNGLPFETAIRSTSLALVNAHPLLETVRPYLPNMIQIAGAHMMESKKLPQDIQQYLDEANDGIIFFSLGSIIHSRYISQEKLNVILQTFAKLPQKILWKFENESLPGKPSNVKIGKWFSQTDILAHPNVKLFITHGGMHSCIEALFRGVPIVGIPIFFDQIPNVANFHRAGYGVQLLFQELTEETFTNSINEVLHNSRYRENIQRASALFKDEPMKPLDKVIFWIEYVIRNKGAPHLRSASLDLTLYQYLLLDIVTAVFVTVVIFLLSIYFVIKIILKYLRRKNKSRKIKSK